MSVQEQVATKLREGRPAQLTGEEAGFFTEALRSAVATALEVAPEEVRDEARLAEDLGLDSVDVFDVLDQLAEQFDAHVALEHLPESVLRGDGDVTFRGLADALLAYVAQPPAAQG